MPARKPATANQERSGKTAGKSQRGKLKPPAPLNHRGQTKAVVLPDPPPQDPPKAC